MTEMDDIVNDFLVESHENLDQLDRDLVHLEEQSSDEVLASVFRTMHTIKGTCGFLGFTKLEAIAHAAENLLSLLRDKVLQTDPNITTALLGTVDAVRTILAAIERDGSEGDTDYSALVDELHRLQTPGPAPKKALTRKGRAAASSARAAAPTPEAPAPPTESLAEEPPPAPVMEVKEAMEVKKVKEVKEVKEVRLEATAEAAQALETASTEPVDVVEAAESATAMPTIDRRRNSSNPEPRGNNVTDSSIRVDVDLLDTLMNLVGELVLARNQILQLTSGEQDSALLAPAQRLNLITTELQEGVMKTRMQPIGNVWSKFPRVVRDLSVACEKHVRLEMDGADTELDKTIIEAIKDPLTHLVRNAIDHGIESPEDRALAGKPAEGRLLLRAYHEGGRVNIEIIDDGKGIDAEAVRQKAIERGLATAEQASRMGQREILNMIFVPGFSTAAKVSNVSGRGVGMDVVKTNIERIGGNVDIITEVGRGSTVKVSIPLTLAIIPALVVSSGGERYAIPQISLLELVRLDPTSAGPGIEMIHGAPVYRLRGQLLPIVFLNDQLTGQPHTEALDPDAVVNIVVLQADDRTFGLVVDHINDTQEIVVKPLGRLVKDVTTFAGATNMGDGRVALILDVLGLAHRSHVVTGTRERSISDTTTTTDGDAEDLQSLLLLSVGGDRRVAIPLSAVARLEEFPAADIELVGSDRVVQYRGEILRLVDLASTLGYGYNSASSDTMHVVVYHHSDVRVGIIVDEVIDIVDEHVPHGRTSLVVDGRVTELVDMAGIAANALGMPDLSYIDFDTAFVQHAPELALAGSNGNGAH